MVFGGSLSRSTGIDKTSMSAIICFMAGPGDPAPGVGSARRQRPDFELHALQRLTRIYCEVCGDSDIDADADLIKCGLQSIDAIRVANLVAEEFGVELALDQLLRRPTLRAAAEQLARTRPAGPDGGPSRYRLPIPASWPPSGGDGELMEDITYSADRKGLDP